MPLQQRKHSVYIALAKWGTYHSDKDLSNKKNQSSVSPDILWSETTL